MVLSPVQLIATCGEVRCFRFGVRETCPAKKRSSLVPRSMPDDVLSYLQRRVHTFCAIARRIAPVFEANTAVHAIRHKMSRIRGKVFSFA